MTPMSPVSGAESYTKSEVLQVIGAVVVHSHHLAMVAVASKWAVVNKNQRVN